LLPGLYFALRSTMRLGRFVVLALALSACDTGLALPLADLGGSGITPDPGGCAQWTDDASCSAHACTPYDCPEICGAPQVVCHEPGTPQPQCNPTPAPPCIVDCGSFTTEAACEAAPPCYALFEQAPCDCAALDCCPIVFSSCRQGPPDCVPSTGGPDGNSCPASTSCYGPYVPAYGAQGCQVGCLSSELCGA
jgi:hypothetical protein